MQQEIFMELIPSLDQSQSLRYPTFYITILQLQRLSSSDLGLYWWTVKLVTTDAKGKLLQNFDPAIFTTLSLFF